jgi:hypothetical protein
MDPLTNILKAFTPISLDEMDSVKLMNRADTKFIFRSEMLPLLLEQLKNDYFILEVEGARNSKYETIYYDTEDFMFFHHHRRGKANRNKVRLRTYVESDLHFFEIKYKNNKDRTIKKRIKRNEQNVVISKKANEFLLEKTHLTADDLLPRLWANYSRITLVNKHAPERLTIDTNLCYKNETKEKALPELVIAEMKQEKKRKSVFSELMRANHISEVSISKYCFGVIFLYEGIRMNNFKPKLLILNKLCHDNP